MALLDQIETDMTEARRRRDELAVRTLGTLKTELVRAAKEPGVGELDDEGALRVLRREVKRREEAAEAFASGGREESAKAERAEAELLRSYLPAGLSDDELERVVADAVADVGGHTMRDMGPVMKAATERVAGRAEPGRIAAVARRLLAG
jgi:uncharacterized protein